LPDYAKDSTREGGFTLSGIRQFHSPYFPWQSPPLYQVVSSDQICDYVDAIPKHYEAHAGI